MDYTRWVDLNGQIIDIKNMTELYIKNCIAMISSGKQKCGSYINPDWINVHGIRYLSEFENELAVRKILLQVRSMM